MSAFGENIRASIARETTAYKLSVLRSQRDVLSLSLDHLFGSSERSLDADLLKERIEALNKLPVAGATAAKAIAEDAATFLRHEAVDGGPQDTAALQSWHDRLQKQVELLKQRTDWAVMFCDVLGQWLETDAKKMKTGNLDQVKEKSASAPAKLEQDTSKISFNPEEYLLASGVNEEAMQKLKTIAKSATKYGQEMLQSPLTPAHIQQAMMTLAQDVRSFDASTRQQLEEEAENSLVTKELSSALSETWRHIDTAWSWPEQGIQQILQTHLNGKQRQFLKLDVVEAIFLQILGQRWSTWYSTELSKLRNNKKLWNGETELQGLEVDGFEDARRQFSIIRTAGVDNFHEDGEGLINEAEERSREAFLQILDLEALGKYSDMETPSTTSRRGGHGDDDDSWASSIQASKTAQSQAAVYTHLTMDMRIAHTLSPDDSLVVLRADLENFGASVPHGVTLAVLKFFGMPKIWLTWFEKYLQIPLVNKHGTVEVQNRGVPFGLAISALANELLLVLLDFAVVSKTKLWIYRTHDDYWLWSIDDSNRRVDTAWQMMQEFVGQSGLKWNMKKTGCTIVRGKQYATAALSDRDLPTKPVYWGMVLLNERGEWTVDPEFLAAQVKQAHNEWDASRSFLGKINIINKYQSFLVRNAGPPLWITGRKHIETIQGVLNSFLRQLLRVADSQRTLYSILRKVMQDGFPHHEAKRLIDGLFIWPAELGGLSLHAHTIHTLIMTNTVDASDDITEATSFKHTLQSQKARYQDLRKAWIHEEVQAKLQQLAKAHRSGDDSANAKWASQNETAPVISEDVFIRYQALHGGTWYPAYSQLARPITFPSKQYKETAAALYWQSIQELYGTTDGMQLIPTDLSPSFAIAELNATTKQLYSS